jgi:hypothetical protein
MSVPVQGFEYAPRGVGRSVDHLVSNVLPQSHTENMTSVGWPVHRRYARAELLVHNTGEWSMDASGKEVIKVLPRHFNGDSILLDIVSLVGRSVQYHLPEELKQQWIKCVDSTGLIREDYNSEEDDFVASYVYYITNPTRLRLASEERYKLLRDRVFDGKEFSGDEYKAAN